MLGTLSRSDFGILTFFLLVAAFLATRRGQSSAALRPASVQFAGAASGLLVVFAHTYVVAHHPLQASTEVKLWWAQLAGMPAVSAPRVVEDLLDPFYNYDNNLQSVPQMLGATQSRSTSSFWRSWVALSSGSVEGGVLQMLLPAMIAVVMFYFAFYRYDAVVQDWYVTQFLVPMRVKRVRPSLYCVVNGCG